MTRGLIKFERQLVSINQVEKNRPSLSFHMNTLKLLRMKWWREEISEWDPARLSWRNPNVGHDCYVFVFLVIVRLENECDLLREGLEREALIPWRIPRPELPSLLSLISRSFPVPYLGIFRRDYDYDILK